MHQRHGHALELGEPALLSMVRRKASSHTHVSAPSARGGMEGAEFRFLGRAGDMAEVVG